MILFETSSNPSKLWFVAAAALGSNPPEEQGNARDLGTRSLRVMVVEDEFFISLRIKELLEALGHIVVAIAVSADEAVNIAEVERPDVVLMDIRLIGARDGIDAAEEIHRRFGIGSIFVTANSDPQTRQRAQAVQPLGFLEKPLTEQRLRLGLSRIVPQ
jgi:two-component system, response regulator PdtaR